MFRLSVLRITTITVMALASFASSSRPQGNSYVLKGTVVTPNEAIENGAVVVAGEKIVAVGRDVAVPAGAKIVETGGVILPGFVDLHNHLTWNVLPRWRTYREFGSRYDWQQLPMYLIALVTPHAQLTAEKLGCAMNRYAEVKAITEGETSLVGSLNDRCIEGMARNLDFYTGFYGSGVFGKEKLRYEVFPLELDERTVGAINQGLDTKELTAFIVHIAEGKPTDASSAREFAAFKARGFLRPGVSIIHGVALKQGDFHQMADTSVGLIWAPRSNFELYGATADVAAALREHVTIALSPDWSPTGSQGMLEELQFANTWSAGQSAPPFSAKELVRMATEYPAQLAVASDKIGALKAGLYADILVLRSTKPDAYQSIVHANAEDVSLAVINGEPVYGTPEMMKALLPEEKFDTVTVCGADKAIYFGSANRLQAVPAKTWKQTTEELNVALREWGSSLSSLAVCSN
jgi:5-methylthioadenosine/S-adenosylhomocysteine deaminase